MSTSTPAPAAPDACPMPPGRKTQELPADEKEGAPAHQAQWATYARTRIPQPVGGFPQAAVLAQITPVAGGQWSAVLRPHGALGRFRTLAAAMAAAYAATAQH